MSTPGVARRSRVRGHHRASRAGVAAVLGATALLITACGGGSPSGSAATTGGGQPGAQAIAYSRCMRAHGVPDFPNPQISGSGNGLGVRLAVPASIAQGNPRFSAAQGACRTLEPNGGAPQRAPSGQELALAVQFAACVRSHGEPGFPDPNRHGVFVLGSRVNTQSPQFEAAERACQAVRPHSMALQQIGPGGP
jgi:hypothetical protein